MFKKSNSWDWENHTEWVLSWWTEFSGQPLTGFWRHILSGCCQVCDWGTCAVHIEDCEGWWLFGCDSLVAEHWLHKPGVLGSIPNDCQPFHFLYFTSKTSNLSFAVFKTAIATQTMMYYVTKYCNMIGQHCTVPWDTASVHQTLPSLAEVGLVCETRHCHAFHLSALYCSY